MLALAGVMITLMLALMVMRMPIALAMFVPGALGISMIAGAETLLAALKGTTMARLSVYELSIIPLFLLMGQLAVRGGLSQTLFDAAAALVGHLRGGLAFASLLDEGFPVRLAGQDSLLGQQEQTAEPETASCRQQ